MLDSVALLRGTGRVAGGRWLFVEGASGTAGEMLGLMDGGRGEFALLFVATVDVDELVFVVFVPGGRPTTDVCKVRGIGASFRPGA